MPHQKPTFSFVTAWELPYCLTAKTTIFGCEH